MLTGLGLGFAHFYSGLDGLGELGKPAMHFPATGSGISSESEKQTPLCNH